MEPWVVTSEISGGKFAEIYSNFSRNLLITYVNQLFSSPILQSDACCKISTFLINNCPDLNALNLYIMFRKNNLFLAQLLGILPKSSENCRCYNKFLENFRKTYNPNGTYVEEIVHSLCVLVFNSQLVNIAVVF